MLSLSNAAYLDVNSLKKKRAEILISCLIFIFNIKPKCCQCTVGTKKLVFLFDFWMGLNTTYCKGNIFCIFIYL